MCAGVYTIRFCVCVCVCKREQAHACTCESTRVPHEREAAHTREGEGEGDDCKEFFSFSNKQSAENRNNCKFIFAEFVLFSRKKKKMPWPKISAATVNLN